MSREIWLKSQEENAKAVITSPRSLQACKLPAWVAVLPRLLLALVGLGSRYGCGSKYVPKIEHW